MKEISSPQIGHFPYWEVKRSSKLFFSYSVLNNIEKTVSTSKRQTDAVCLLMQSPLKIGAFAIGFLVRESINSNSAYLKALSINKEYANSFSSCLHCSK